MIGTIFVVRIKTGACDCAELITIGCGSTTSFLGLFLSISLVQDASNVTNKILSNLVFQSYVYERT
jgi:hypothetical protein